MLPDSLAASGPQPNSTTDPSLSLIPPGLTLEQFLQLQAQLGSIGNVTAAVLAILLWDYFILFREELAIYTTENKAVWKTPATWLFIILRYSGILATLPSLWFTSLQTDHCVVAGILSQLGVILAVISSGGLFTFRVVALYRNNIFVKILVGVVYAFTVASYITVSTRYKLGTGPHSPIGSNCVEPKIPAWAVLNPASSVTFDTVVLLLTIFKITANDQTRRSRIGRRIYQDNLLYFTITTVTNITVLVMFSIKAPSFAIAKACAVPFSTLMVVTMGTRVYLNLRLSDERGDQSGNSFTMDSSVHSRSRRITKGFMSPGFSQGLLSTGPLSPGLSSPAFPSPAFPTTPTYVSTPNDIYETQKTDVKPMTY